MKYAIAVFAGLLIMVLLSSCSTTQPPTSVDTMKVCKSLCTRGVKSYSDDNITCSCQGDSK